MSRSSLHLDSPRQPLARPGAGSPAPASNAGAAPATPASTPSPSLPRSGGDHWRYSSQLNQQLTAAQRALGFVDSLAGQLEALKGELSGQLTQRRVDSARLSRSIEQVAQQWSQRGAASGGSLDSRLQFRLAADARQTFTVRGLEIANLTQGAPETLVFFSGEPGSGPAAVKVGEPLSEAALLAALGRALAPSGIQPQLDEQGQLQFSVAETAWQGVRERFSLRGGGIRFPAGQPQHLKLQPTEQALQPQQWQSADHAGTRQTLQKVLRALDQLQLSRAAISRAMAEVRHAIAQLSQMSEQLWADGFVNDFNARFNTPDSESGLYEVVPALLGVSRYRVLSLLALP
ncbi:hypothetical protein [Vogesella indigofera]|uniref:hypothetical protein n=1 Tax=Vogesella indigofera TaxID=45465 RepID=UPI0035B0DECC